MYLKSISNTLVIASLLASSTLLADDNFKFGGYFRAGTGGNSEGGDQVCLQAPGAGAKFRLGNECEAYTELDFNYSSYAGDENASEPGFDMKLTIAAVPEGEDDFEQFEPAFRNLYAKSNNFFTEGVLAGSSFWGGKRFYRRNDIHMNDFYYWDTSGAGAGIEDISMVGGKLHVAYFRNTNDDLQTFEIEDENGSIRTIQGERIQVNDLSVQRLDLRLSDIKLGANGSLTFGV